MTVPIWEIVIVVVVVGVALAWGGRAAWRAISRGTVCSDCADSGECPLANDPEFLERLGREGKLPMLEQCGPGQTTCAGLAESFGHGSAAGDEDGETADEPAEESNGEPAPKEGPAID